jgi:hypothetical protein
MQAIALVTGDDFLVSYNLSIGTEDVVDFIRNLTLIWNNKNFFQVINFDDTFGVRFAEILGPHGFCYSFNIIDAKELYNLDGYTLIVYVG